MIIKSFLYFFFILSINLIAQAEIHPLVTLTGNHDIAAKLSVEVDDNGHVERIIVEAAGETKKLELATLEAESYEVALRKVGTDILQFKGVNFDKNGGEFKLKYLKNKTLFGNKFEAISFFLSQDLDGKWVIRDEKDSKKKIIRGNLLVTLLPPGLDRVSFVKDWISKKAKDEYDLERADKLRLKIANYKKILANQNKKDEQVKNSNLLIRPREEPIQTMSTIHCHSPAGNSNFGKPFASLTHFSLLEAQRELRELTGEVGEVTSFLLLREVFKSKDAKNLSDEEITKLLKKWLENVEALK